MKRALADDTGDTMPSPMIMMMDGQQEPVLLNGTSDAVSQGQGEDDGSSASDRSSVPLTQSSALGCESWLHLFICVACRLRHRISQHSRIPGCPLEMD